LTHTFRIDPLHSSSLLDQLKKHGFLIRFDVPYAFFLAQEEGISITLYHSGSLVLQGQKTQGAIALLEEWISQHKLEKSPSCKDIPKAFLKAVRKAEPMVQKKPESTPPYENVQSSHLGSDETGKGDFFGPLCVAALYASPEGLTKIPGIQDSKKISDTKIKVLAEQIKGSFAYHTTVLMPTEYNDLYEQYRNLNHLLAQAHADTIQQLTSSLSSRDEEHICVIDQFAQPHVIQRAFTNKKIKLEIFPNAETEDPIVAGASILARDAFLQGMEELSQELPYPLLKGASSAVLRRGIELRNAEVNLKKVCKLHFSTYRRVMSS